MNYSHAIQNEEPVAETAAQTIVRNSNGTVWRSGDVEIDSARWLIRRGSTSAQITHKELGVLRILMNASGSPVPRSMLWDSESAVTPNSSRSLDAHVWSIRKKIERDPANPVHLLTIAGYGYQLR